MNKDKLIGRIYLILGVICCIVFFIMSFPWKLDSDIILDNYQLLQDTIATSIHFEEHYIQPTQIPHNVTLTVKYNDNQTTSLKAEYLFSDYIAPRIEYDMLLSPNYEILDKAPEKISLSHYTLKTIGVLLSAGFIIGVFLPLPILFFFSLIWDFIFFIRKKKRRIKRNINTII